MKYQIAVAVLMGAALVMPVGAIAQDAPVPVSAEEAPAQPVAWGMAEVDAYILANQPRTGAAANADPFAVPAAAPAPNRDILFTYEVGRSGAEGVDFSGPNWSYDAVKQELTLTARPGSGTLVSLTATADERGSYETAPRVTDYFSTFADRITADGGERSNAYGATVQVTLTTMTSRGLTHVVRDRRLFSLPATGSEYSSEYQVKLTVPPEEARAMVERLRFVVTGNTEPWAPGKYIICGTSYIEPTFQRPHEILGRYCFLNAVVRSVGFVDMGDMNVQGDGRVLAEWSQVRRSRY